MRLFLFILLLFGSVFLRAEVPVTEFDFSGASDSASGKDWTGQDGWTNAFNKACRARITGVAIAPPKATGGQSGMKYAWEAGDSETIAQITVTCIASTDAASKASKTHTLGVSLNGAEPLTAGLCFDGELNTPRDLTFRLEAPATVSTLTITNETASGSTLFEVCAVSWQAAFPGIEATFVAPGKVTISSSLSVSLQTLTGGSGSYTDIVFSFNGETARVEGTEVVTFQAPDRDGIFPLTLTVTDSFGETAVFTQEIAVVPRTGPTGLTASEITRRSFTLSWDRPVGSGVTSYIVRVDPVSSSKQSEALSPVWKTTAAGWEMESPFNLAPLVTGLPVASIYLILDQWSGSPLHYSFDGGETWGTLSSAVASRWILADVPTDVSSLLLRTPAAEPPETVTPVISFRNIAEQELDAAGLERTLTFSDLPAGSSLQVTVTAVYQKNGGTTTDVGSDPLQVDLLPIPPFASVVTESSFRVLTLAWPTGDWELTGNCLIAGTRIPAADLTDDLCLSRVCFTRNTAACNALSAGKAIAISNLSSRPVALDGSFTCTITKAAEDGGEPTVYTWDFAVESDEGVRSYPYVVPAGGELLFRAAAYGLPDLREGVIPVSTAMLKNLTDNYTVTLLKNGTVCNTLIPRENAVVRLSETSLEEMEVFAITNEMQTLDAFYTPWGTSIETEILDIRTFTSGTGYAQFSYAAYLQDAARWRTISAICYLTDAFSRSEETVVTLYETPAESEAPGYRLLLR